jgi:hypothetical protein
VCYNLGELQIGYRIVVAKHYETIVRPSFLDDLHFKDNGFTPGSKKQGHDFHHATTRPPGRLGGSQHGGQAWNLAGTMRPYGLVVARIVGRLGT